MPFGYRPNDRNGCKKGKSFANDNTRMLLLRDPAQERTFVESRNPNKELPEQRRRSTFSSFSKQVDRLDLKNMSQTIRKSRLTISRFYLDMSSQKIYVLSVSFERFGIVIAFFLQENTIDDAIAPLARRKRLAHSRQS